MASGDAIQRLVVPTAFDLSSSPSALFTWKLGTKQSIVVKDVRAVYTEISGPASTAGVLSLGWANQAVAEAEVGTITDAGQAVGADVGFDTGIDPLLVKPGDTLYFRLKTQATSGTTTGAGYFVLEYTDQPL